MLGASEMAGTMLNISVQERELELGHDGKGAQKPGALTFPGQKDLSRTSGWRYLETDVVLLQCTARSSVLPSRKYVSLNVHMGDLEIKQKNIFYGHERLNLLPAFQPNENDLLFKRLFAEQMF